MLDPDRTTVTPEFKAISTDILRSAARGLLSADSAYHELCRRLSALPAHAEKPPIQLPSRAWFDREIRRRTPPHRPVGRRLGERRLATGAAARDSVRAR
jgi:hypothetical protein